MLLGILIRLFQIAEPNYLEMKCLDFNYLNEILFPVYLKELEEF
jgi:hypothetical protein